MAIRIVYYKSIFSDAGIIHTMPNDSTLEDIKKELGVSSIARIVQNNTEIEYPITTDGSELIIYETVQGKTTQQQAAFIANKIVKAVISPWHALDVTFGISKRFRKDEGSGNETAKGTKATIESSQGITGASNSSATIGTPIPIILGTRKVSPIIVGTYWTQPTYNQGLGGTKEDLGENIFLHGLLVVGYGPLMLTDFRLGDLPLGQSLNRNTINDQTITIVRSTNNNLHADDEIIFHVKQEAGDMAAITYVNTTLEEQLPHEVLWPKTIINEADYHASAPVRLTERGVKSVSVTLSAKGLVAYNSTNNPRALTSDTLKLCYREVGSKPWITIASKVTSSFKESYYTKEIRIELKADYPGYTVGHERAIEVTVLRSRMNMVDDDPSGNSYLDIWKWTSIRTVLAEKPISDSIASKICRIAFRIKATEYLSGNLDAINMIASSILPVAGSNNKWVFTPGGAAYPNWAITSNPASIYVAAFMDKWCTSEEYTKGAVVYTGWEKLAQWQTDNVKLDWKGLADLSRWSNNERSVSVANAITGVPSNKIVGKYAECNTVVTSAIKLIDLLSSVLDIARGTFIYRDGKYSLIHDARYGLAGYNNPSHGTVVTGVLNPRLTESLSFTRTFEDTHDEAIVSFTNSAGNYYKQMSVTVRNKYITDIEYNKRKANGTLRVLRLSQDMITDVYQLKMWIHYAFATSRHRQIIATAVVGHLQYAYPIGSRIRITHDVLLKGYVSARITSVTVESTYVDISFDMPAEGASAVAPASLSCVIYIVGSGKTTQELTVNCIALSPVSISAGNIRFDAIRIPKSAFTGDNFPSVENTISVGMGNTLSEDFLLVGKNVTAAHGATLSLIQMADNVHEVDTDVLSEYTFNVTQTQRAITDTIVSSVPADVAPPLTIGVLTSINSALSKINFGDDTRPPADVPGIVAIAFQDYISIEIQWNSTGLNNDIQYFSVEIFNGTSWKEIILSSAFGRYDFARDTDYYPEATGTSYNALNKWKIRARAVNIYGQESLGYGPSIAGAPIDTTSYKTWIPTVPVISELIATEDGLAYKITHDTSVFYGSNIRYSISLNSTLRIASTYDKAGKVLFDRVVDKYPETKAERLFNSITLGTALDDFSMTATCITNENAGTISAVKKPNISQYKTWIPRIPTVNASAAGRSITLAMTAGNDTYGKIENHIQIQNTLINAGWFALGSSADAYGNEANYKTGAVNGYTTTPLSTYDQSVPLTNQTLDEPKDTAYNYRVRAKQLQEGITPNPTAFSSSVYVVAKGTGVYDIVKGAVKKAQISDDAVTAEKILNGSVIAAKIADSVIDMTKFATGVRPPRTVATLPAKPYTGYIKGDLVVLTTDSKLYRLEDIAKAGITGWTTAVAAVDMTGEIVGTQIKDGAISTEKMTANSINGDRITGNTLNANKITANTITAGQIKSGAISATEIASNAITASKLLIGDMTNLVRNPSGELGTAETWFGGAGITIETDTEKGKCFARPAGLYFMESTYDIPVKEGEKYHCYMQAKAITPLGSNNYIYFLLQQKNKAGVINPSYAHVFKIDGVANTWKELSATYTVPAGVSFIRVFTYVNGSTPAIVGKWLVRDITLRRQMGNTLIEDGAITTDKMVANSIEGDRIKANTLHASKIAANSIMTTNLNVTSRNKINSFVNVADGVDGWTAGSVIQNVGTERALLVPNGATRNTDWFEVLPDELVCVSFGVITSAGTGTSGCFVGITPNEAENKVIAYSWNSSTLKWAEAGVENTNAYFASTLQHTTRINYKSYILGSNVDIKTVPFPVNSSLCFQLRAGVTTIRIRALTWNTTKSFQLISPSVIPVGASKIVAEQMEVTNLSAISGKLGEIHGDTADYKLVMGSGGSAEEGTFLLGSETDPAYLRRWKKNGVWNMAIKLATFIVDAVSSKIKGVFEVQKTDGTPVFKMDPDSGILTAPRIALTSKNFTKGQTGVHFSQFSGETDNPGNDWYNHIYMHHANAAGHITDLALNFNSNSIYMRTMITGAWRAWDRAIMESEVSTASTANTIVKRDSDGGTILGKTHINGGTDTALLRGSGYLNIGNLDGMHISIDNNEIMAKSNGTTPVALYINSEGGDVNIGGPTSIVTAPTPAAATNNTQLATTAFVKNQLYATLASPALIGTPTAPTPAAATNNTQLATTAFVKNQGYEPNRGTGTNSIALGADAVASGTNSIALGAVAVAFRAYQITIGDKFVYLRFAYSEAEATVYNVLSPWVNPTAGYNQGSIGSFGVSEIVRLFRVTSTTIELVSNGQGLVKTIRSGSHSAIGSDLVICTVKF